MHAGADTGDQRGLQKFLAYQDRDTLIVAISNLPIFHTYFLTRRTPTAGRRPDVGARLVY